MSIYYCPSFNRAEPLLDILYPHNRLSVVSFQLSVVSCQLSVEKTTDNKLHRTTDDWRVSEAGRSPIPRTQRRGMSLILGVFRLTSRKS